MQPEVQNTELEPSPPAAEPENPTEPEADTFSDQFTGTWQAPDDPQWSVDIRSEDGTSYTIEITWNSDSRNTAIWQLTGVYDEIWEGIAYVGAKYDGIVNEGGLVERIPVPEREEISGFLYIEEDGVLYWIEDFDHAGDGLYFVME